MSQKHDFDRDAERRGTDARKYDPTLCPPDVIPMWIADTDFHCPQELLDALTNRVQQGHLGYPYNDAEYGRAVAHWQRTRFGWNVQPEWVDFAPGAIAPLLYGIRAFSAPGDKVLIQTPAYPPFYALIENNGRRVVRNPLELVDGHYEINFDDLEKGLSDPRTRIMMLCNPHNPAGREYTEAELQRIGELCLKHNVFVLSDEIHGDIVYGGRKHTPFASLDPRFAKFSCTAVNPSKTFNTAGLRTAAFIAPDPNVKALILEQRMNNKAFGRPVFGALSVKVLYTQCAYYADELIAYLEENVHVLEEGLADVKGIRLIKPEATYLLWLDCRELHLPQPELVRFFKEEAKLLLNDGQTFGVDGVGFMRMNIACPRATLRRAITQLRDAAKRMNLGG